MARPTSTGTSAYSAGHAGGDNNQTGSRGTKQQISSPRQRSPIPQQAPPPVSSAPNSRQQARPTVAIPATSAQAGLRNDRERSAADKEKDKEDPKMIGPWRIGRTIGKGSSGRVKIAKHVQTGQYAAVKIVPKNALISSRMSISEAGAKADKALLGIEREIVIMKLIEHPSVMRLYDVWETASELYLILEYVEGGELFDYLVSKGRLHADEALHYFQQIISGVDYCHRFNICHRDLKPENLLLDRDRNIKIADFGMAALERNDKLLETSCGSPHYASPEIVAGLTYHGSSSDIWSCGIILFALLTGRLPFDDDNIRTLLAKVKVGKFNMPQELPHDAKDLIRRMLEVDPGRRITMEHIRSHPWFTRRQPRELPYFVQPPTPDQIDRPVSDVDEIDDDILANLRTLWNGADENDIIEALVSREKTWEKVFYCLLLKYRTRHMENANIEEPEVRQQPSKPSGDRSRKPQIASGPTRSKRSKQSLSDIAGGLTDNKPVKTKPTSPPRGNHQITRPAPPVPSASSAVNTSPIRTPASPTSASPWTRGPLPQTPAPSQGDTGLRSSALFAPHDGSPSVAATTPVLPSIHLQEPTPQSAERIHDTHLLSPRSSTPASPTPSTYASSIPPHSPVLPNIAIPDDASPAMQRFFHDVVDQLQAMAMRTPSPSQESSPTFSSTPDTPNSEHRISFTPVIRARDQFKSAVGADASQFADAEEEENAETSLPVQQQLQRLISSPQQPRQPINAPLSPVQPLSIRKPIANNNISSPLQSRRSVRQPTTPVYPSRPPILRPISHFTNSTTPKVVVPRRGASTMLQTSPIFIPGGYVEDLASPADKENYNDNTLKSALASGQGAGEKKKVTLGLAIAGVSPQQSTVSAFEPTSTDYGTSKLKRKSKHFSTSPMFSSPNPTFEAAAAPRGSWFSNLFNWKSPSVKSYGARSQTKQY